MQNDGSSPSLRRVQHAYTSNGETHSFGLFSSVLKEEQEASGFVFFQSLVVGSARLSRSIF